MTGRVQEEAINPVDMPVEIEYLWRWFLELSSGRQSGMSGPSPVSETDIGWFFHNRQISPQLWELSALRRLDQIAVTAETKGN